MREPLVEEASWRHIGVRVVEALADQAGAVRGVSWDGEDGGRRGRASIGGAAGLPCWGASSAHREWRPTSRRPLWYSTGSSTAHV